MKKQRIAVVLIAAGLGLATAGVRAQETVPPDQGRTSERERDRRDTDSYNRADTKHGQYVKASKLIGMKVKNDQGERLGKVDDLIIDSNHNVKFAVIASGGAVGVGEKRIAVPIKDLTCSPDETIRLSATKEQLRDASKTPTGKWLVVSGQEWNHNIDGYYGHPEEVSVTTEYRASEHRAYREPARRFERETVYDSDDSFDYEPVRAVQGDGARRLMNHPEHANLFNDPLYGDNRPRTANTSDEATQQCICDSLKQNYSARTPENVSVTVQDGVVTLRGTVDNATDKRNIESSVKQMSGVRRVNNQLTVQNR